jgi:hypothetical protein
LLATAVTLDGALFNAMAQDDMAAEAEANVGGANENLRRMDLANRQAILRRDIDRWVGKDFGNQAGLEEELKRRLEVRLDELRAVCHLDLEQMHKLTTAGHGDIKRLTDRVYSLMDSGIEVTPEVLRVFRVASRELKTDIERAFAEGSLFAKIQSATLRPDQIADLVRSRRDKSLVKYRDAVNFTTRRLARLFDLTDKQREEFTTLILNETAPPLKFGRSEYALVMFQAAHLNKVGLRAIFTPSQWAMIAPHLQSWADSGEALRHEGFEFEESKTVRPAGARSPAQTRVRAGLEREKGIQE